MTELHYLISPEWRTLPLNRVLRQGLGFSALGLKSVRERGCVRLDGLVSPLYQTPGSAERLSIVLPEDPPSEIEPVTGRLHLLYEDTHLLIVDKPAGMAVHPGPGHHGDTLGNLLMGHYAQEGEHHLFRPVNRLDRSTSGLMCVAKHAYAAERLGSLAAERRIRFLQRSGNPPAPQPMPRRAAAVRRHWVLMRGTSRSRMARNSASFGAMRPAR